MRRPWASVAHWAPVANQRLAGAVFAAGGDGVPPPAGAPMTCWPPTPWPAVSPGLLPGPQPADLDFPRTPGEVIYQDGSRCPAASARSWRRRVGVPSSPRCGSAAALTLAPITDTSSCIAALGETPVRTQRLASIPHHAISASGRVYDDNSRRFLCSASVGRT